MWLEHQHAQAAAELVQGNGDMVIVVSIDPKCDEDLRRLGYGHPANLLRRDLGSQARTADSTARRPAARPL